MPFICFRTALVLLGAAGSACPGFFAQASPSEAPAEAGPAASLRVDPGTGVLSWDLAVGVVPGDLPVPVVFCYQGAMGTLPNLHFGFLTPVTRDEQGGLVEEGAQVLEDGTRFTDRDWHRGGGEADRLAAAYGWVLPPGGCAVDRSRAFGLWDAALADLGPWRPQVTQATTATRFKVLMGGDRARIYGYVPAFKAYVPVLWVDGRGHWVAFRWEGEPECATFTLRVLNAEGKGIQLCWAGPGTAPGPVDLLRADFIGLAQPSLLVRGYPGSGPRADALPVPLPAAVGIVGRPTQVQLGRPGSLAMPAFMPCLPDAPATPGTPVREWRFAYADLDSTELSSLQEPLGVTNTFSFQTLQVAGGVLRGVSHALSEDPRTGATWRQTWVRALTDVPGEGWTVSYHSLRSDGAASEDRTTVYTYGPSGAKPAEALLHSVLLCPGPVSGRPRPESGRTSASRGGPGGDLQPTVTQQPRIEVQATYRDGTAILAKETVLVDGTPALVRVFTYEDFIQNLELAAPVVTVLVSNPRKALGGGGIRTATRAEVGDRNAVIRHMFDPFAGWEGPGGEGTHLSQIFSALEHAAPTQNGMDMGWPGQGSSGSAGTRVDGEKQQLIKKLQTANDAGKCAADGAAIKEYLESIGKAVVLGAASAAPLDDVLITVGGIFGGPFGAVAFLGAGTLGGAILGGFSGLVPSSVTGGLGLQEKFKRNEYSWQSNFKAIQNYSDINCQGKQPEIRY